MPASGDFAKRVANIETGHFAREVGEYERLVVSTEDKVEVDTLHSQIGRCNKSWKWWLKVVTWSIISIVVSIFVMKWGVPYVFDKVKS
ncbi:hypothetical protein Hanom_Chr09g00786581 [Helianthus anomalus]